MSRWLFSFEIPDSDMSSPLAAPEGLAPDTTNATSPKMMKIGAMKETKTASSNCLGLLIGPMCASDDAWYWELSLMASSKIGGLF